jgi:hypothetical protein
MTSLIKTITSVLKASADITTNIPAHPIGLAEILTSVLKASADKLFF